MSHRRFHLASTLVLVVSLLLPGLAAGLQKGQAAPALQVTSTSGQRITNANYDGHLLLVQFFATWCSPCRESIPAIVRLSKKYGKQGFQVLGLSIDESGVGGVKAFIAEKKITYPVALADDALQDAYGVRSVPILFLINRKGQVVEKFMGMSEETEQAIEYAIKTALADK
jgi:cytochrome c biogenesis protein CcmG, thiol:disulfide interchange protein DsbE